MLDSPALIDLGHGTVRYRLPDEKREQENTKVKTGYFYHPRLDDFSEGKLYMDYRNVSVWFQKISKPPSSELSLLVGVLTK